MSYSVVSYFCGCGGLDLGFLGGFEYCGTRYRRLPFNIIDAFDNNQQCIESYNDYFAEKATLADLGEFDPKNTKKADVLIGGFPCQDFSSCGPLKGLSSDRGNLYKTMIRYMEQYRPKIVVGENVINIERMEDGAVLETIIKDLENVGYKVKKWNMFAPDYGIPQRRHRIILVCVRSDLSGFPNKPRILYNEDNYRSIEWAIGDLINTVDESVPNQSQFFKASKAKRGNGQGDEKNVKEKPAYTIRANPKSRVQFHYLLDRRLTVRECARIQTFPDDYKFKHSMTTSISQIGNAVPPVLGYEIAKCIARYLKEIDNGK